MEVEQAQGLGTTHLYPANTGVVGHGLKVREGMVWWCFFFFFFFLIIIWVLNGVFFLIS